jgi:hypothetical protein
MVAADRMKFHGIGRLVTRDGEKVWWLAAASTIV